MYFLTPELLPGNDRNAAGISSAANAPLLVGGLFDDGLVTDLGDANP
jgi:hypothetical protein